MRKKKRVSFKFDIKGDSPKEDRTNKPTHTQKPTKQKNPQIPKVQSDLNGISRPDPKYLRTETELN